MPQCTKIPFQYKKALCRAIASTVADGQVRKPSDERVDLQKARLYHEAMVGALRSVGVEVTVLEADDAYPDCVFVEDMAVVIGDIVLLTNPGAESRRGEVASVKSHFLAQSCFNVVEMELNGYATLDGGDVMYTGSEIFVGNTSRTNERGIEFLRDTFAHMGLPVHVVDMRGKTHEALHLKSVVSMASEGVVLCSKSYYTDEVVADIQRCATQQYKFVRIHDDCASNVVAVNNHILCQSEESYPKSVEDLNALDITKLYLDGSELSKVDGCLTCSSVLY